MTGSHEDIQTTQGKTVHFTLGRLCVFGVNNTRAHIAPAEKRKGLDSALMGPVADNTSLGWGMHVKSSGRHFLRIVSRCESLCSAPLLLNRGDFSMYLMFLFHLS